MINDVATGIPQEPTRTRKQTYQTAGLIVGAIVLIVLGNLFPSFGSVIKNLTQVVGLCVLLKFMFLDRFVFRLALSHQRQGRYERSIKEYAWACRLMPNTPVIYYNRGLAYNSLRQYPQAIADFDKLIALDANYPGGYYIRALAYFNQDDFERAIADLEYAIQAMPDDPRAYVLRGFHVL